MYALEPILLYAMLWLAQTLVRGVQRAALRAILRDETTICAVAVGGVDNEVFSVVKVGNIHHVVLSVRCRR